MKFTIPFQILPTCSYKDILMNTCTLIELRELTRDYGLDVKQSAAKKVLVEAIEKAWVDNPEAMLLTFPQRELKALKRIIKAGGHLSSKTPLETLLLEDYRVIQYSEDEEASEQSMKTDYALAMNLRQAIEPVIDKVVNDPRVVEWDKKEQLLLGFLHIYGVLSEKTLLDLWKLVTGKELAFVDMHFLLIKRQLIGKEVTMFYRGKQLCIATSLLEDPDTFYTGLLKRKDLDYAVYPIDHYLNAGHFIVGSQQSGDAILPLLTCLQSYTKSDETIMAMQIGLIWYCIQVGMTLPEIVAVIKKELGKLPKDKTPDLVNALVPFVNSLPRWQLKGHIPDAIQEGAAKKENPNTAKQTTAPLLYQLHVKLKGITPPIWRRILVPSDLELADLHLILQTVMGWTNSHLHQFIKNNKYYSTRVEFDDPFWEPSMNIDYEGMQINELLQNKKERITYEYDYGDSWMHILLLEDILLLDDPSRYPLCTGGARSCPLEDCGGVGEYMHVLDILKNPKHPERAQWLEWVGEDFDPEAFELKAVNEALKEPDYGVLKWDEEEED